MPDIAEIRALVAGICPRCEHITVARPPSGLVNRVLLVLTSHEEFVLKIFADDAGQWKPQKERALFDHMRSIGIPTPRVLRIDTSKRTVPFSYGLTERCAGEPFSAVSATLSEGENARIYDSLGDYIGRLHATTFDRFGDVADSLGRVFKGWYPWRMVRRHELTETQWAVLEPLLPPQRAATGRPAKDHRTILNGIRWRLKTGTPWRDLPQRYGPWQTVYTRFRRWQGAGVWDRILAALQTEADARGELDWDLHFLDGTTIRAHPCAAGAKKGAVTKPSAAVGAGSAPSSTCGPTDRASRSPGR